MAGVSLGLGAVLVLGRRSDTVEGDSARPRPAAHAAEETATGLGIPGTEGTRGADFAAARTEVPGKGDESLSLEDLRRLLSSSSRFDQIRAIELLLQAKTLEANGVLLEALLAATDPILLSLLEEGLLRSSLDIAPSVMGAFRASRDPEALARLAGMLAKLAGKRPSLEREVAEFFIGALKDSRLDPERAASVSEALVALGIGALDPLAAYVADPLSDPEGAGNAAWVLAQLSPEHGDALREKLGEGFDSILKALRDPVLAETEKNAVLQKTGSLAWAASLRPQGEHDLLGDVLVSNLTRTPDQAQAGTLAWGIANLKGLSDEARLRITQSLLDSAVGQSDTTLAQSYMWAVSQMVTSNPGRPLDANFYQVLRAVEDAWQRYGQDPSASPRIQWLLSELRAYEKKKGS
ncbi:MAG TPA: hypothetical protein VFI25_02690 [Planctomycetota bacterium]|nr:hypothetical protein [Planctomycetota bacterium]